MKGAKEILDRYRVVNELYNIAEDVRKKTNAVEKAMSELKKED